MVGVWVRVILHARNDNSNKLLELLNVVTSNFIGLKRAGRLFLNYFQYFTDILQVTLNLPAISMCI